MRAIVLTPAVEFPHEWRWAYEVEAAALRRGGVEVEPRPWSEPGDLSGFDAVLPLVAWGYQDDPARWYALLDRLEGDGGQVLNPLRVLRWNTDKAYLAELDAANVPTVPTRRVAALDATALEEARHDWGAELVVKPPISAAAYGTHRLGGADPIPADVAGRPMMIQPFLRSVMNEGEYSLMFFDGAFSHAIVKRARAGDYRVQPHLGGSEMPCKPPSEALEVAATALSAVPERPAYARVDLIRLDDGQLAVIELELIEPSLWLEHAPDKGASFAAAIRKRAGH